MKHLFLNLLVLVAWLPVSAEERSSSIGRVGYRLLRGRLHDQLGEKRPVQDDAQCVGGGRQQPLGMQGRSRLSGHRRSERKEVCDEVILSKSILFTPHLDKISHGDCIRVIQTCAKRERD